jgi:hypothetical protein
MYGMWTGPMIEESKPESPPPLELKGTLTVSDALELLLSNGFSFENIRDLTLTEFSATINSLVRGS